MIVDTVRAVLHRTCLLYTREVSGDIVVVTAVLLDNVHVISERMLVVTSELI